MWEGASNKAPKKYTCGYCNAHTHPMLGYSSHNKQGHIYLCTGCDQPTYFSMGQQIPAPPPGQPVKHVPDAIGSLYMEVRKCASMGCMTTAALGGRTLLMKYAVECGAPPGLTIKEYVEFLAGTNQIHPDGKAWVDRIRQIGNDAAHKIPQVDASLVNDMVVFLEMLLRFKYELPGMLTK